jgi:hypothetical protein
MALIQRKKPPTIEEYWEVLYARSEEHEQWKKDYERQREEFERKREKDWAELKEMFAKTDKKIGELGNSFGDLAEHLVAPGIIDRFRELGLVLYQNSRNRSIRDGNSKTLTEVDLLLENDDYFVAVEVKARVKMGDINRHMERLEILRLWPEGQNSSRKIMGAIAGAIFNDREREAAVKEGLYVIVQSGDTVKIDLPEGFKPLVLQA